MRRLSEARTHIRRLAIADRPGAIVLAEHAVDQHADLFGDPDDKIVALDALVRDLIRMARLQPEIIGFVRRVDDYIQIVQRDIEAIRSAGKSVATIQASDTSAAQASELNQA